MGFGTVLPAGAICRRDVPEGGVAIGDDGRDRKEGPFLPDRRGGLARKVRNNLLYIANLFALRAWYAQVRSPFFLAASQEAELLPGALGVLEGAVAERLLRLRNVAAKMPPEGEATGPAGLVSERRRQFRERWTEAEEVFREGAGDCGDPMLRDRFLAVLDRCAGRPAGSADYLPFIQALEKPERLLGTAWLESIVNDRMERVLGVLTAFRSGPVEAA